MIAEWLIILVIALVVFGPLILKARKNSPDE
jgi:Sec-independent protein translocase protein TatA